MACKAHKERRDNGMAHPFGIDTGTAHGGIVALKPIPDEIYNMTTLNSEAYKQSALRHSFVPEHWLAAFHGTPNPGKKKQLRCLVQAGTVVSILRGGYALPDGKIVKLNKNAMVKCVKSSHVM